MDSMAGFIVSRGSSAQPGRDRLVMERAIPAEHLRLPVGSVGYCRALRAAELVTEHKRLKMHALTESLWTVPWPIAASSPFEKPNILDRATR